jgi:hypothetical protein
MTNEEPRRSLDSKGFIGVVYDLVTRHWPLIALLSSALMLAIAHAFETFGGWRPAISA